MILYDYIRSTASLRVRIALALKDIAYETVSIALSEHAQHEKTYLNLNPQALVPALKDRDWTLTQSLAILEYLDDTHPTPPLLPASSLDRAQVRSIALFIACEMHPLNNLRVREQLKSQFQAEESSIHHWCHHWLKAGFDALTQQLTPLSKGKFCFKNELTLADLCLFAQVASAKRFEFPLVEYPLIEAIYENCLSIPAFQQASR